VIDVRPIEVRPCADTDELRRAFVIWHYFGSEPTPEDVERFAPLLPPERMHAAWDGDEIVGGAGAFAFDVSVPGGRRVPAAGTTVVGVLPTHRRRGILRELMRAHLDAARERGEPVAYLWASEATIYGRFGYGLGALTGELELPRERTAFALPAEPYGRVRIVPLETALEAFPQVYERIVDQRPGMFARSADWWRLRTLADRPERREGAGPHQRVLLEVDGRPEGYAVYRMRPSFEAGAATGSLVVVEAMGATPAATRAIWRFLLDVDWTARIEAEELPVDHPLWLLLAEPRRMRFRVGDSLWVRLVDVGAALSARGYGGEAEVVLDVRDAFCPWNEGRWRVTPGGAERTDAPAGLALDVTALGCAYLGGFTFSELEAGLRVEELEPGAVARADALFRVDRAPWCPEVF
jgi:predicted acetyltransferase